MRETNNVLLQIDQNNLKPYTKYFSEGKSQFNWLYDIDNMLNIYTCEIR